MHNTEYQFSKTPSSGEGEEAREGDLLPLVKYPAGAHDGRDGWTDGHRKVVFMIVMLARIGRRLFPVPLLKNCRILVDGKLN